MTFNIIKLNCNHIVDISLSKYRLELSKLGINSEQLDLIHENVKNDVDTLFNSKIKFELNEIVDDSYLLDMEQQNKPEPIDIYVSMLELKTNLASHLKIYDPNKHTFKNLVKMVCQNKKYTSDKQIAKKINNKIKYEGLL